MNEDTWQEIFNYFAEEHNLLLLDSDRNEIQHILDKEQEQNDSYFDDLSNHHEKIRR